MFANTFVGAHARASQAVTLSRVTRGTYDPATGTVPLAAPTSVTLRGVVRDLVRADERHAPAGATMAVEFSPLELSAKRVGTIGQHDHIVAGGVAFVVLRAREVNAAGRLSALVVYLAGAPAAPAAGA